MSEMFSTPELDARLRGLLFKSVPVGVSTVEYIFEYDCFFNGASITSSVTKLGTRLSLETQYQAAPGLWFKYKKFAKEWNMFPGYVCKTILHPTKPRAGIKLLIHVDNQEGMPIDIGVNLFTFIDSEMVNPSLGQQGADW
jgi:hypothetical protein